MAMDSHHVRNTRFWKEFFRMYRSMPELWLTTAKDYRNRKLKTKSYDRLLQFMRTCDPSINIHMLKRKINNLRTSYRRELRKVLDNKAALERGEFERGSVDDYKPSLWYYNELEFLHDLETSDTPQLADPKPEQERESEHEVYQERTEIINDIDDNVVEVALGEPEPDEDIFAEPYQPEEDMMVIEGGDGDGDVEGEGDGDGDGDGENESIVDGEGALEEEVEHGTLNETRHKSELKMESKYQQKHSNNNNNNNNSSSSNSISRHTTRVYPYSTAQSRNQQQQQQQQLHQQQQNHQQQQQQQQQRRSIGAQQMNRYRHSSTHDGDVDVEIDEERSIAAGKKRRRQMMSLEQHTEHTESECDLIGKRIAAHFRNMRADQRLFAERIISEVLVFGRMNRLSLSARFLPNGSSVGDVYARDDGK